MSYLIYISKKFAQTIILLIVIASCNSQQDTFVRVSAKFFYINQTSDTVVIKERCGFEEHENFSDQTTILPGDTVVFTHKNRELFEFSPSINNYPTIQSSCLMIFGDEEACQFDRKEGFGDINNYVDRKELSPNNYEFTYLITEQVKAETVECP